MSSPLKHTGERIKKLHKWEAEISTQKYCEQNIYLHTDASPVTGMVTFDDTPHIEEVLKDFDKAEVWKQLMNWSTQTGKTFTMQCCWAKAMDTDPARMQWSIKNKNDVGDYLEEKINPFLRGIKNLQDKIVVLSEEKKKKTKAASINIAGGGTTFTGTTDAERRSKSVKYYFGDEIALYGKGHFVELEGRTKSYERHYRKIMAGSSRKKIDDEMDVGYRTCETIKEWQTYCCECDAKGDEPHFYAESQHFKYLAKEKYMKDNDIDPKDYKIQGYIKEAMKDVHIECPNCTHKISNKEKDQNILDRKYKFKIMEGDEDGKTIGYKANALAVRITSFETIATIKIKSEDEDDFETLHQFYIDYFNEFYEEERDTAKREDIRLLGNGLSDWEIPEDVIPNAIYMGVDSQKDHFWYEIKAYEYGKVSNTISFGRVETLSQIEDIFRREMKDKNGESYWVQKLGIDRQGYVKKETIVDEDGETYDVETQNNIDMVDEWCMDMVEKYGEDIIYPTIGKAKLSNDMSYQMFTLTKDFAKTRKPIPLKAIRLSNINLKTKLQATIDRAIMKAKAIEDTDKGHYYENRLFYVNQSAIDLLNNKEESVATDYDRQLTSEVLKYPIVNGRKKDEKSFVRVGRDNHLFDTSVICEMFADMDRITSIIKPIKEENNTNLLSSLIQI